MRGNEWWGQRDDGTWVRWNGQTMDWEAQPAPPASEMTEVTRVPPVDLEPGSDAPSEWVTSTDGVDPETGIPLPPGSKVYQWETRKTFGHSPEQDPPGAKTFRFSLGKRFGPFPFDEGLGPDSSPQEVRRAAIRSTIRQSTGAKVLTAVVAAVAIAVIIWLTNS
jgi:hypothetical protein